MHYDSKKVLLSLILLLNLTSIKVLAQPTVTEYAECSGMLIVAAALTKDNDSEKSAIYLKDAEELQHKASKLKEFNITTFKEVSFNASGNYIASIKRKSISDIDFWSDAGYCRGLAQ